MLDKWNSRVTKWKEWAVDKGLTVEFIPWWSSDLIERLQKPENVGLTYFWFNKEEFTDEWCKEQSELSISDLGKRYTPKLNVKLKIAEIFNGISRDENFNRQVTKFFDDLLIKGNKAIPKIKELDSYSSDIQKELKEIHALFSNMNFQGIQTLPIEEFLNLLRNANQIVTHIKNYYLDEESKLQVKPDDYRYYKKFGYEISHIRDFEDSIYELTRFLEGTTMKLANHPFLLLEGEAGIGKSHLLADIISTRTTNKLISLFFFSREYYWSSAYNYFNKEYYGGMELREVHDNITGEYIGDAILTTNNFLWEEKFDKSNEDTISFLKPSKHIYENMKLVFSKKEGEFIDDTGEIICFDPSVYYDSKSYLLVRKKPFINYLKENNLRILWTVLGEKNIIGGHSNRNKYYERLEISGAYYLNENNEIEGKIKTKNT